MKEHADHYDAELLLRLYELRREQRLRQAREWFSREFQAESVDDFNKRFPPGSDGNTYYRMATSYWEMAASIVNRGLINEELFFENTAEFYIVWLKIRHLAPAVREQFKNSTYWHNVEELAGKYENWMAGRAPEALGVMRKRFEPPAKS